MKHSRNHGFALLAALILLVTLSTGLLTRTLNQRLGANADQRDRRELIRGMRDAQLALIAHALIEDNTPGTLPAPSGENSLDGRSNPIGYAGSPGQTARRLPWHFLALSPKVAGECLWYAVASAYRNSLPTSQRSVQTGTAINPVATAILKLAPAASNPPVAAAAVVIAPGRPIDGQNGRQQQAGTLCAGGNVESFLENENTSVSEVFITASADRNTNDIAIPVTHEQLMYPVLRRVLATFNRASVRSSLLAELPASGSLDTLRCNFSTGATSCPGQEAFDSLIAGAAGKLVYKGNCPGLQQAGSATDYKHPVSWLCFNDWYAHIRYDRSSAQLSIAMPETGQACHLSLDSGRILCIR